MGMMQEEMAWESASAFGSDVGSFSLDHVVCLSWVKEALGAEALDLWTPKTSSPSLSPVEVALEETNKWKQNNKNWQVLIQSYRFETLLF